MQQIYNAILNSGVDGILGTDGEVSVFATEEAIVVTAHRSDGRVHAVNITPYEIMDGPRPTVASVTVESDDFLMAGYTDPQ